MKRILIAVGVCLAVLLLGNIFAIGDKLSCIPTVGAYVEGIFYIALVVVVCYYVVRPIYRIQHAPELPKLSCDNDMPVTELRTFGRRLAQNCHHITDSKERKEHSRELAQNVEKYSHNKTELQAVIDDELKQRCNDINRRILGWAKTVFVTTSISQSSRIDTALVLYLNLKMIEDLVRASGFRPNKTQMIKTYGRILSTAIIAYGVSEVLEDADLEEIVGSVAGQAGEAAESAIPELTNSIVDNICSWFGKSLLGGILKSAGDGAVNALLTLRIGYVTRQYLLKGRAAVTGSRNRAATRRLARREAWRNIKGLVKTCTEEVKK